MSILAILSIVCAAGSVVCAVITYHYGKETDKILDDLKRL